MNGRGGRELRRLVRRRRAASGRDDEPVDLAQLEARERARRRAASRRWCAGPSAGVEHVAERRPSPRRARARPRRRGRPRSRLGMSIGTYGPASTWLVRAAARIAATPGVGGRVGLRPLRPRTRASPGPGASVSGTSVGAGRGGREAGEAAAGTDRVEERRAGPRPPGVVAGSAAIGQIHATFSGSPIGAPSAAGATATRWVTKLDDPLAALRVAQLDLDREHAGVRRPGQRQPEPARVAGRVRVLEPQGEDRARRSARSGSARGRRADGARRSSRAGRRRRSARTPVRLVIDEWTIARASSPASGPVIARRSGTSAPSVAHAGCSSSVTRRSRPRRPARCGRRAAAGGRGTRSATSGHDARPTASRSHRDRPITHSPAGQLAEAARLVERERAGVVALGVDERLGRAVAAEPAQPVEHDARP